MKGIVATVIIKEVDPDHQVIFLLLPGHVRHTPDHLPLDAFLGEHDGKTASHGCRDDDVTVGGSAGDAGAITPHCLPLEELS